MVPANDFFPFMPILQNSIALLVALPMVAVSRAMPPSMIQKPTNTRPKGDCGARSP
ncbi:hypothetical protein D3C84_1028490 [compost metagenome]